MPLPPPYENIKPIDAHTHVFPDGLFEAIWHYFEKNYWHINYKLYGDRIAEFMEQKGFAGFTTLNYAHKPDISPTMNEYVAQYHKRHPMSIPFGTLHPGDKDLMKNAETALTSLGLLGFKFQLLVTDFFIDDPRLMPVYDLVKKEDKMLVFHAGTGPIANNYVGFAHFKKFIDRYPDMRVQVAHLGSFEYGDFFGLLHSHPNLYMDSAMILVDHTLFPAKWDLSYSVLLEHEDQLLFGTDFPNIPYDFAESYKFLLSLDLGRSFYEKFFAKNAKKLYRL